MRARHKFVYIEPLGQMPSDDKDVGVFFEVHLQARAAFAFRRTDVEGRATAERKLRRTITEVQRYLKQQDTSLREGWDEYDPTPPWDEGGLLIDWLQDNDDKHGPYLKKLNDAITIRDVDLLSALALIQLDRAIAAIKDTRALEVARFCIDLADLLAEIDYAVQLKESKRANRDRAVARARRRHAPRDEVKRYITAEYLAIKWPSVLQAAKALTPKARAYARKLRWTMSPDRAEKTVYDWLREAPRNITRVRADD